MSPIIVDIDGDGFDLTDAVGGVRFDIGSDGYRDQVAWTAPGSDDAWLALDRNGNGQIDNGLELFGNVTPMVNGARARHGYEALAEYDQLLHGGNGDGFIDTRDRMYRRLRLWRDSNHNGMSESNELHPLPALGVIQISLNYETVRYLDSHGNIFRYRSRVRQAITLDAYAYDVFLRVNP
jgi:hypothetical protein